MIKNLNDVVRFLFCEVFTICLIIKSGINLHSLSIEVISPVLIVIYWWIFMAPKSNQRLNEIGRIFSEFVIFGGTGLLTYVCISQKMGVIYLVIALINTILEHVLPTNYIGKEENH
ncbi:YrdB family protein [Fructilactobacillus frigidiflavus]|uniref:YrdB family protein n=1 Tax=Fructilactobacillus frigidiflavus TaxID=3242688 RepID=UPI0037567CA6